MDYKLALLAKDIHNSVLPLTYDLFGRHLGFKIDFEIANVTEDKLAETVTYLKESKHGFTVTMPYKVAILDYCDILDESAQKCGSSNCVLVKDGKLIGYNTDGWGMIKYLNYKGFDFKGKKAVMVGAGGVALSIAYNLSINGIAHVDVINLMEPETSRLISRMGERFTGYALNIDNLRSCCKDADIFINASILGQIGYPEYEDLSFVDILNKNAWVFDVNYSNPHALLPKEAAAHGLTCCNGKPMSSFQGIRAMEIWTGKTPDQEAIEDLVRTINA